MNDRQNQKSTETEKLKEIPKWARRYAQSRTMPMIIFSMVFIALFGVVSLSVYLFLKDKFILAAILIVLYIAVFIYFLITSDRHEARYFTKTGIPQSESMQQIRKYLSLPLILFCFIMVIMKQHGVFPAHLRVPISAAFICPLLIFANWHWARNCFIGYLWAGLYGARAIVILLRIPILTFPGRWAGSEMVVAIPLTGLVTGLLAHIYNRYALKKLKEVAHLKEGAADEA